VPVAQAAKPAQVRLQLIVSVVRIPAISLFLMMAFATIVSILLI
jgi:hypothetical protein